MQFSISLTGATALLLASSAVAFPAAQQDGATATTSSAAAGPTYTQCGLQVVGGPYDGTWITTQVSGSTSVLVTGASQSDAYPFGVTTDPSGGLLMANQAAGGANPNALSAISLYLPDDVPAGAALLNCTQGAAPENQVLCNVGQRDNVLLTDPSNPNNNLTVELLIGCEDDGAASDLVKTTIAGKCYTVSG